MKLEICDICTKFGADIDSRERARLLHEAGETLARNMLAAECGAAPEEIVIKKEVLGKPYAENLPIHFNISHSGSYAVCVTHASPVGVDIQAVGKVRSLVLRRSFSAEEREYVLASPDAQAERFTRLWCMKEAWTKRLGGSIFSRDGFVCRFKNGEPITDYSDFSFAFPSAPDGYVIAVCL